MIRNLTPHPVTIVSMDGTRTLVIDPDGPPARVEFAPDRQVGTIYTEVGDIPLVAVAPTDEGTVTGVPDFELGVWLIVSRMVAESAPERRDLLVPHDIVRDADGQIIGCRALATIDREQGLW